jgi:hypothetical protein
MKKGDKKGNKEKSKYNKGLEANSPKLNKTRIPGTKKPVTH